MIGLFLALIEMTLNYECALLSGRHFILTLEEISTKMEDPLNLFDSANRWAELVRGYGQGADFIKLFESMQEFYEENHFVHDIAEISQQIF